MNISMNATNENAMWFDSKTQNYVCPKCRITHIRIKPGVFVDLFICENCNFEAREVVEMKSNFIN